MATIKKMIYQEKEYQGFIDTETNDKSDRLGAVASILEIKTIGAVK